MARAATQAANALREAGLRTELYLNADNLGKQLKYASTRGIPSVVIVGPDEAAAGKVTLRDMGTGAQETIALGALTDRLGSRSKLG